MRLKVSTGNESNVSHDSLDRRLRQTVRRYVTDEQEFEAVASGKPFYTATSLDSVSYLELVVDLEEAFQVSFDGADAQEIFASLEHLARYLRGKVAG